MQKTPDEIKKGLECCADVGRCIEACPYGEDWHPKCVIQKSRDALAYIQQLERERDALVALYKPHSTCGSCKHYYKKNAICDNCTSKNNCWEWRGVKEDVR